MNRHILSLALSLAALSLWAQDGPTMGWSSWNTYGVNISDALIRSQADAMVSTGLKDAGYNHINIDDGFFGGRNTQTGELLIHPTRFPNGLKPVADYIHAKGLRAGIYSDAGANTCGNMYNGDNLSVNVGLYRYDQRDADFYFKECGFDFIKVDFCGGDAPQNTQHLALDPQERYTAISQAIKNTGRDDVRLNVCRWNYPGTWVHDVAFSWRTTQDIWNGWASVKDILSQNLYMSAYSSAGHFNDMDMLEVGRSMTGEEDKTHFGLWCMMNSPLLIGCDLTAIKPATLALLTNPELIALNQDPLCQQAYPVEKQNQCFVLVRDLGTQGGPVRAFAVYNPTDQQRAVTVKFSTLCLSGDVALRDLFTRTDLGTFTASYRVIVPAHGTRIYRAEGTRTERIRYEGETAYITAYQELKNNQTEKTGIYEYADYCSSGMKAGWLGCSERNDLIWRDVYSAAGGDYTLTLAYISGADRSITVTVNGENVQTLTGCNSGGWSTVATKSLTVTLNAGRNTVRLSNAADWMPDIDYIELQPVPNPQGIGEVWEKVSEGASSKAWSPDGRPATPQSPLRIERGRKFFKK